MGFKVVMNVFDGGSLRRGHVRLPDLDQLQRRQWSVERCG
jgi:hypothetical protein